MKRAGTLTRIILLIIVPTLLAYLAYTFMLSALVRPLDLSKTEQVSVEVTPGMTFRDVCRKIQEHGIVRYARGLEVLAKLKGSATDKIKAGEYVLSASMSPKEVLTKLISGQTVDRKVVLKEGSSIWELPTIAEQAGLLKAEELEQALRDPGLLARFGVNSSSFEGYLFPETYIFSRPIQAREIIFKMIEQGEKNWPPEFTDKADALGMSRHEILTLASIIEKESGKKVEEQPTISSVFHNRLKAGMKLQSDPTVIYGLKDFNGNLTKENLQDPHPYNTYVHIGLPPGPICCPGASAIKAALEPTDTQYLFFVADGSGGHAFSTTLAEHNENVAKYQLRPNGK